MKKINLLFLCVANSARSQIAEAMAKLIFGSNAEIHSAGSKPTQLNPLAIEVLNESKIEIINQYSKTVNQIPNEFIEHVDYIITLCQDEVCPVYISKAKKLHWPLPDPAGHLELSKEEQLNLFRQTREQLKIKLIDFKNQLLS